MNKNSIITGNKYQHSIFFFADCGQVTAAEPAQAVAGLVSQQLPLLHTTALHCSVVFQRHQCPLGQCARVCEEDSLGIDLYPISV